MTGRPTIDELRTRIDSAIERYLGERRAAVGEAIDLIDEIDRVVTSGGKRLRPMLCYWGFRAGGGDDDQRIVRAAVGFELLHTFAIVHDDIMDSSTERRGHPTSFARMGMERALLTGDLALVLADGAVGGSGFPPEVLGPALASYGEMQQRVIAGQYLDIAATEVDELEARRIATLKSGSYSIEGPLVVGALLAGPDEAVVSALHAAGSAVGEAFQLRDDVLGMFGDPAVTGKSADADIRDGKRHYLYAATRARLPDDDRDRFEARWGASDLSADEIAWLREAVDSSGARGAAEELIEGLHSRALKELAGADIPAEARSALEELFGAAIDRRA